MKKNLSTLLGHFLLCLGLCLPYAAWSAETPVAAASKPTASTKTTTKSVKAKSTTSAPGCDESNDPAKKLPGAPKCPERGVKATSGSK